MTSAHDDVSFRHLSACGLGPGWRCWAVHAGGPSVPAWMARRVGPSGDVLVTRPAPGIPAPAGCRVLDHDIAVDGAPESGFDLVHARFLLARLPNRDAVLGSMIAALRPGGVLLVEEFDHLLAVDTPAGRGEAGRRARRVREDLLDLLAARGEDLTCGRKLPHLLRARDLHGIGAEGSVAVAGPVARAIETALVGRLADALAERGEVDDGEIGEHLAAVASGAVDMTAPTVVSAWGRRTASPSSLSTP